MEIREVDVYDEAVFHRCYEIGRIASLHQRPDAPMWSEHEIAVMFRHPEKTEEPHMFGAFEGEEIVGVSQMFLPLTDNTNMTYAGVYVEPTHRRRGIGGMLIDDIVERSRATGRPVVLTDSTIPLDEREGHPYRRFAEKHGFAWASTEVERRLTLPVPEDRIQGWIDEAAQHHPTYEIRTFTGPLPEELLESYCRVSNRLAVDAPTGDIEFEEEALTPTLWRDREDRVQMMGRTLLNTLALDTSGEAVAVSTLAVPEHDKPNVYQWATLVLAEHRGHRLGLATKAHNLRALQRQFPDYARIWTGNEETNRWMVGINERLGFERFELVAGFQRKL